MAVSTAALVADGALMGSATASTTEAADRGRASRDVRLFWWAGATDALGSQASGVVLPLLLLGLGHSAAVVGTVAGVSTAAGLLLAPLAAVPADRGARKPVMFWSALVSALAMAGVATVAAVGTPPLALLLGAVLLERFSTAVYEAAAAGTVLLIAPPGESARVVAGLSAGEQGALVLGPALGGALYQLSRALPFVADAVSYAVTAVCVKALRSDLRAEPEPHQRSHPAGGPAPHTGTAPAGPAGTPARGPLRALLSEVGAGFALVRTSPFLRLVVIWTTTVNGVIVALYYGAVFTLQKGGHGGAPMGLVLALSGAAGLAGSLAAPRIAGRIGAARLLVTVTWLLVPLAAGLATAEGPWTYGALFGVFCLLMPVVTVVLQSRAIQETPPGLQARTGAVLSTAVGGSAALAPVLAGLCATYAGTAAPAVLAALVLTLLACRTTFVRLPAPGAAL
ncbi:MFS transporter [Streptomyces sp. cg36]|uniref:MFS transporter n=1 Tax=Streptomyces sp. cg36 TaxID=3238798 RepID=UPI0034E2224C